MQYVFVVFGILLAAAGLFGVVMAIRSISQDDPDKFPLLFRPIAQSLAPMNTAMGVLLAIGSGVIAILGLWTAYKALTGW